VKSDSKIYVAGHTGLVGSSILRCLYNHGYTNIIVKDHSQLDLIDTHQTNQFFSEHKPEYVFLAAARVGGIVANSVYPAEFIYKNLMIQTNVIHAAYSYGVKKLLFLGSSCIYPKEAPKPLKEECLLSGHLEGTNEPYAIAKIAGIKMCQAYNKQYGFNAICVMPTNLYGPNDNFDEMTSHVVPSLIAKIHNAKKHNQTKIVLWGNGKVKRDFMYVDDLADACLFLMLNYNDPNIINVGTGESITIDHLARTIMDVCGHKADINYNSFMPSGVPSKDLDLSKIHKLGWHHKIDLKNGLTSTYQWFLQNYCKEAQT